MSDDEVGIVTNAFSKMLDSIRLYIMRQRTALETEARMKQQELSMAAHLREAQLRYLQAQINPHFLFNSLNAGAQLAMLEGAEKTEDFLGRMADFFRYNVKKTGGTATLEEEIASVDNYIYILNVRFAGDIHYSCRIGDGIPLKEIEMPSMILQPIVENAIQHGIHDDHENGKVLLGAERIGPEENETGRECICITVSDNGCGMTSAQLEALMKLSADRRSWENRGNVPPGIPEGGRDTGKGAASGEQAAGAEEEAADAGDRSGQGSGAGSAGIALANVMSRLELYYNEKNLFSIWSDGAGCGTEVTVLLPIQKKTEEDRLSGQE
jgi:sensor histidine kinase YesM